MGSNLNNLTILEAIMANPLDSEIFQILPINVNLDLAGPSLYIWTVNPKNYPLEASFQEALHSRLHHSPREIIFRNYLPNVIFDRKTPRKLS